MGEECGDYLFDHHAVADIFFQYHYELFAAGGGDGVRAERLHYRKSQGNGDNRGDGPL